MTASPAPSLSLVPKTSEVFVGYSIPAPEDKERRRHEARLILATLLARHILTLVQGKEDVRKVA